MNKTPEGISMSFLKTAKRLPRKGGKIVLNRNNPEHVSWAEGGLVAKFASLLKTDKKYLLSVNLIMIPWLISCSHHH